ncbi:GIGYF family protein Gyf isoform X1 [Anastrepha ludens]|uniref:GIGYF family protein Gyf isoform X1 n=1 Tax=Anastrepha ludens TaxID=28586 RepID=UPI0023B17EDB|nr:GIGYF family protein Gyf isoform X1 [Anastrepha ludens]XP_053969045.1 GIGYF family protein Gyf isoform X1 [Anastrepha ludens]XP_053969046.1 GIGYF family protein Gyf isoform X1 [Anastrepha ludens]XP_053969047.1 GIGYF family protein Gyf isoform X1 [Anastrepha ludens]
MTDSMKFGPEWLRNMADNTNLLSSGGTSLSNSGNVVTTSSNSNNGGSSGGHHSFGIISNVTTPAITQFSYALAPRNTFPEFRYGREEMLSLFDKNYNMPEILPAFKTIFVEKVQLPLALTPSTDEELLPQAPPIPTQRPSWMQRSPVGFSSSARGTGRGGSVDRGRMRGKSNYHQIYQRPTALFGDDDLRSVPIKADRGWPERNGAADLLNTIGANIGGIGLSSDWNGTPTSSPRKEFSNHPRNMENWRRNRSEDVSNDASTSGLGNAEGWRGSSTTSGSFTGSHRWGRSTSWRDEDVSSASPADVGYCSSGGSGMTMQRSYSNITTVNERGGYIGSSGGSCSSKAPQNNTYGGITNQTSSRSFNSPSGLNTSSTRTAQWNINSGGIDSSTSGRDGEDNLPEWAMENPADGGGTFDASGAFHGSVDEDESEGSAKECRKKSDSSCESSARNNEGSCIRDGKSSETSTSRTTTSLENDHNKSIACDTSEKSAAYTPEEISIDSNKEKTPEALSGSKLINDVISDVIIAEELDAKNLAVTHPQNERKSKTSSADVELKTEVASSDVYYYNTASNSVPKSSTVTTDSNISVHRDLSDRMREVTDDMIEKLIMDDDAIGINDDNVRNDIKPEGLAPSAQVTITQTTEGNNLGAAHVFTTVTAMLKQAPHQALQGPSSVSPTLASTLTDCVVHKGIQLYGGGVVVDHATMQHHHLQQQQLTAVATANLTSVGGLQHGINSPTSAAVPADLWYYRDPQSKVQGPFTAIEMTEWYRAGYFNENLYVRRLCDTHFHSLGDLIKLCNDNMPFTHSHLIPNLDNMHLSNSAAVSVRQQQKPQIIGDYALKQKTLEQNESRDQLKGNLISGTDYLGGSVKNLMIPVDVSNMYFQMLRHQEMLIYRELSDNECFQQLAPSEKETVVRQKLQIHSEYLSSLSGLSNTLPSINPTSATHQLYDVMMDGSKKLFGNTTSTGGASTSQQPQPNSFLDTDEFLRNSQHVQQPVQTVFSASPFVNVLPPNGENTGTGKLRRVNDDQTENELLNNFHMRMFLPPASSNSPLIPNPKPRDFMGHPNTDFLSDTQLLATKSLQGQNNSLVQSWLSPVPNRESIAPQQSSNEWANNMLVGIPITVEGGNSTPRNVNNLTQEIQPQKAIPMSMWDLPTLENAQSKQIKQGESNKANCENSKSLSIQSISQEEEQISLRDRQSLKLQTSDNVAVEEQGGATAQIQQRDSSIAVLPTTSGSTKQRKDDTSDKYQNGNTKRIIKQNLAANKKEKGSDESFGSKKNEEERRRDQAEDKRRLKEERKRQQADEEKRRQQQIDEEKRRQMLEEKERQQQIQALRRKAMMGNNSHANNSSSGLVGTVASSSKPSKEQRVPSSIAPWSTHTNATAANGSPCLAEIQKAERRERLMEQRQMEMFVKRVRASAAAAVEAFDSMLKWNAPTKDVPVKSFAEIQAEEAKRLSNEQMEMQRRKDQEQQQAATAMCANSNTGFGPNNISAIWSGTKVWGPTSTASFWEEPIKFSAAVAANNNSGISAVAETGFSSGNINMNNKLIPTLQQKSPTSNAVITANDGQNINVQQNTGTRNLRKSQTVSVMQNTGTHSGKSSKINNYCNTAKPGPCNKVQPQKAGVNNPDGVSGTEKRGASKTQLSIAVGTGITYNSKRDDYENDFIAWCTKILNSMNTKLDVPTFVTFLRDLESPYEVKDYIRMYLGENKESVDFGKQFLERRSKYKNLQRAQNAHNDDMCKPAPAITPSGNDNSDNKGKQKKVKKNKMTKLDARILGFSVTAAEGRTNVGDRVYVDAP